MTGGGVTAHSGLSGLTHDDHAQYLLASGTRGLSGNWDAGAYDITAGQVQAGDGTDDTIIYNDGTGPAISFTGTVGGYVYEGGSETAFQKTVQSAVGFKVGLTAGVSGSFTTVDGKTVTVVSGIITAIV